MTLKTIASALAMGLTFAAFLPYLRGILRGQTRPHVFSWVIWGSTTFLVFLAQLEAKGGVGAWPIGLSGLLTLLVAFLAARKRGDLAITRVDWAFFLSALASLPVWLLTRDPLGAVIILTLVDLLGFGPTLRKAYAQPRSESPSFFALFALRNGLVVAAMETHSLATVLFPAAVGLACLLVIAIILLRRNR